MTASMFLPDSRGTGYRRHGLLRYARLHVTDGWAVAASVLVVLLLVYNLFAPAFTTYQLLILSTGSLTLAFAAVGETFVVLTGGFDLSPGAIIAFTNVVLATNLTGSAGHQLGVIVVALVIATAAGACNGILVAYVRLQSIIVTIATMFVFDGLALFVLARPGGHVPSVYSDALNWQFGPIPVALVVVVALGLGWILLRRTRFGKALYAIGTDRQAAAAAGVRVAPTLVATYALSGLCYGLAGLVLTAQMSSGDPGVGSSFLLTAFVAVVLGGTKFGGGVGSAVGSIIGAFITTLIVGVLTVSGVNSFATNIAEGLLLILAVLLGALTSRMRMRRPSRGFRRPHALADAETMASRSAK